MLCAVPLAFSPGAYSPVNIKTTVLLACAFFIAAACVASGDFGKKALLPFAFIGWMCISAAFSRFSYACAMPIFTAMALFVVFFAAANFSGNNLDFIRKALVLSFIPPLAAGVLQIFFPGGFTELMAFGGRVPSLMGNPNFFAAYIIAVLPVVVFLYAGSNKWRKAAITAVFILAAVCLVKTGSKAGMLAAAAEAATALYFFMKEKKVSKKKAAVISLTCLALSAAFLPAAFNVPYNKAFDPAAYAANASVFFRINTWQGAFNMGMKNIFTGTGPGSFSGAFPSFRPGEIMKWSLQSSYEVTYPENIFLQAFAELGALGLLGSLAMVFMVLKSYDPIKKDIYLGFTGLLCMNLVGVDFNYVSSSMLAALFAGLIMNREDKMPRNEESSAGAEAVFRVAGALFAAALIAGCVISVKKIISDTYLNKAIEFSGEAKWGDAVEDYKKSIEEDKYNITAGYFLAQAYYDSNPSANAAAALGQLEEIGKLAPDYVLIHYRKAVILSGLGRADEAEDEYKKMIKIDPYFKEALEAMAYISYNRGDWDSALSYTNRALEKYPLDAALYSYLGNIYFASKRPDEAVLAYKKAVEISGNKDYYYNLSCIYYSLNDFPEAMANIDEAIKRGGKDDPKVEKMAAMIEKRNQ